VQTQDFWPNGSILSSHNLTSSSHCPFNIDLHPSVTQANPRRPIDVQKACSPKARPKARFFVPIRARPDMIAQAGRGLPPWHGGRPDTIFIGRPDLTRPHGLTFPQPRSNLIISPCASHSRPPIPPRDGNGVGRGRGTLSVPAPIADPRPGPDKPIGGKRAPSPLDPRNPTGPVGINIQQKRLQITSKK
jgi:hypothetical protein